MSAYGAALIPMADHPPQGPKPDWLKTPEVLFRFQIEAVPSAISTVSPLAAALMPAWMVGYWDGTLSVAAWATGGRSSKSKGSRQVRTERRACESGERFMGVAL